MLKIVTDAEIDGEVRGERPVVLHKAADDGHGEIHVRVAESLAKLGGMAGEKVGERSEE